jgi:hypothetical protein
LEREAGEWEEKQVRSYETATKIRSGFSGSPFPVLIFDVSKISQQRDREMAWPVGGREGLEINYRFDS